ncbi:MAG: T9SS type A sorting domain-containing protein [Bacteroidetes bacterium]|nr:T9SS type A sorting domain-containing protein [Bacteroidota bacterium]HET6243687.1 T9SS type A sorting domain-containing protein [Bacteroidia bacterium]
MRIIFLFCLLFHLNIHGQTFEWAIEGKGVKFGRAFGEFMDKDEAGNIYVAGYYLDTISINDKMLIAATPAPGRHTMENFIIKIDKLGNLKWAIRQGKGIEGICIDNRTGSLYVTGTFSGSVFFGSGNNSDTLQFQENWDGFLARYDTAGNFIWARHIKGVHSQGLKNVKTDSEGNIFVLGQYTKEIIIGDTILYGDYFPQTNGILAKYDKDGNLKWLRLFKAVNDGNINSINCSKLSISGNQIFISGFIIGKILFGTAPDTATLASITAPWGSPSTDIFLGSYDLEGNFLWAEKAGGVISDAVGEITSDSDGNVYITGSYDTTATFGRGGNAVTLYGSNIYYSGPNRTANFANPFVAKYRSDGSLEWVKNIKRIRGHANIVGGISLDKNSNIFIGGTFHDTIEIGNKIFTREGPENTANIFVAKLNNKGDLIWLTSTHTYNDVYSEPSAMSLINDEENNCYLTGMFTGKTGFGNILLETDYYANAFIVKIKDYDTTNQINSGSKRNDLNIYPNPTQSSFTIHYHSAQPGMANIIVRNLTGAVIFETIEQNHTGTFQKQIDLGKNAHGVYFVELLIDRELFVRKLIVSK